MRLSTSAFVVAAVTLLAGSAWAHHNMSALFDFNDRVTVSGTLTRARLAQPPHLRLRGRQDRRRPVADPGAGRSKVRRRASSAPAKSTSTDIEAAIGKTVTAEVSRARDGSTSGLLRVMTLPDGKVVSACPQNC